MGTGFIQSTIILLFVLLFATAGFIFRLTIRDKIRGVRQSISKADVSATILFLIMTFVILPLLPDKPIDPLGLINLYRIWIMVVLVAGISFFGYIAIRVLGSTHGIGLAGLFGGLISSTAVAMSMARRIHENGFLPKNLAIGIVLASSMMLIRAGIEMWVVHPALLEALMLPIIIGSLCGYAYIAYLYVTSRRERIVQNIEFKNPFDLKEALLMGVVFGITLAIVTLANQYSGNMGVYAVSFVSGFADVDAIILSLSSLAKSTLLHSTAQFAIVIAIISNTLVKMGLVLVLGNLAIFRLVLTYYLISVGTFALTAVVFIANMG